ncbi:hypothetical protein LCGC14_2626450 [marine sediment metagenome]|uniref:C2H2-type domain-containing protein n=1 Tax=marine sediment metagenome TaxID=412755 RepID=A0A0F9CCL8_9ZZZZ
MSDTNFFVQSSANHTLNIPADQDTMYGVLPVVSAPPYVAPERPKCPYCGKECWSPRGLNQHIKRNLKCLAAHTEGEKP